MKFRLEKLIIIRKDDEICAKNETASTKNHKNLELSLLLLFKMVQFSVIFLDDKEENGALQLSRIRSIGRLLVRKSNNFANQ